MVLELLSNPIRADLMGQAARKRMLKRYVWDQTLAPLAQLTGREPSDEPQKAMAGAS
jgi:hypothetical protein